MKTIILIVLVLVLAALASAGVFMLRRGSSENPAQRNTRMARALALRVGLSIALFVFILLAWFMGWIHPTGIPTGN